MKRIAFLVVVVFLASAAPATAQGDQVTPFKRLLGATSLRCTFGSGVATSWESDTPTTKDAQFGGEPVIFDSINAKAGKGRVIANQGASDVAVLVTPGALTFLETTAFGNVMITTVFSAQAKAGAYKAVTSRHVEGMGSLLLQQYYGTCRIWG
jgi:hypothetical protein